MEPGGAVLGKKTEYKKSRETVPFSFGIVMQRTWKIFMFLSVPGVDFLVFRSFQV